MGKLDDTLHITDAAKMVDGRLQITKNAQQAGDTVRSIDSKYAVRENAAIAADKVQKVLGPVAKSAARQSKIAASKTVDKLNELNETHQVTDKLQETMAQASTALQTLVARALQRPAPAEPPLLTGDEEPPPPHRI